MSRRRALMLLPAALAATFPAAAVARAQPSPSAPFRVEETARLRVAARQLGWTVLRDREAPAEAAETGMVLIRAQRPVPPPLRPGHLAALLRNIRVFRFEGALMEEPWPRHASGLPAATITARATSAQTLQPVVVRAVVLYAPTRSVLAVAAAPVGDWDALAPEFEAVLGGLRAAGEGRAAAAS
jgi:hypothetical protein